WYPSVRPLSARRQFERTKVRCLGPSSARAPRSAVKSRFTTNEASPAASSRPPRSRTPTFSSPWRSFWLVPDKRSPLAKACLRSCDARPTAGGIEGSAVKTHSGAWQSLLGAAALLAVSSLAAAQESRSPPRRIVLRVSETAGIRRFGYPVNFVLQLPEPVKRSDDYRQLVGAQP